MYNDDLIEELNGPIPYENPFNMENSEDDSGTDQNNPCTDFEHTADDSLLDKRNYVHLFLSKYQETKTKKKPKEI